MGSIRLMPGVRYQYNGQTYEVQGMIYGGNVEVQNLETLQRNSISSAKIKRDFFENKVHFEIMGKNVRPHCSIDLATEFIWEDFAMIPERYRNEAWERYIIIKKILDIPYEMRKRHTIMDAVKRAQEDLTKSDGVDREPPGFSSVYRWLYDFNQSQDIRSLVPRNYRSGNKTGIDDNVSEIIDQQIKQKYLTAERPTVRMVYNAVLFVIAEINRRQPEELPQPSYSTVLRRVQKLNPYEAVAARHGNQKAKEMLETYDDGVKLTRILQRVEIDSTMLDLMLVDEDDRKPYGRETLYVAIDAYSRYPLGFALCKVPSAQGVLDCLYHAIINKDYVQRKYPEIKHTWDAWGVMEQIVVDRGIDFQSMDLNYACAQLNISILDCPARTPKNKGIVERFFGTINKQLVHAIPGTTRSNTTDKGDYKSVKKSVLTVEKFIEAFHIYLVDAYAHSKHRGLKGGTPAQKWAEGMKEWIPAFPVNPSELRILLSRSARRVLQKNGIELFGIFYYSSSLTGLRSSNIIAKKKTLNANKRSKVILQIKYDENDISRIWVWDESNSRYLEVKARNYETYKGVSLYMHKIASNALKKENSVIDKQNLAEAYQKINEKVSEEHQKTKAATRKRSSRLLKKNMPDHAGEGTYPETQGEAILDDKAHVISNYTKNNADNRREEAPLEPERQPVESNREEPQAHSIFFGSTYANVMPDLTEWKFDYSLADKEDE